MPSFERQILASKIYGCVKKNLLSKLLPLNSLHELVKFYLLFNNFRPDSTKKIVRLRVDLFSAHPVTEVVLNPCGAAGSNGAGFRSDSDANENKGMKTFTFTIKNIVY